MHDSYTTLIKKLVSLAIVFKPTVDDSRANIAKNLPPSKIPIATANS